MENPLTIVDFVVLAILMISGLIATYRGFMKEALSVSSWAISALAAVFFWPVAKPLARAVVQPDLLADILGLLGVFVLLLIPISFVSFRIQELVRGTRAGPLDRSLGFVFGVARGLLVAGLGYLVYSSLATNPKDHPYWVRDARLLPVIKGTADVLRSLGGSKSKAGHLEEPVEEPQPQAAEVAEKPQETRHADAGAPEPETKAKPATPVENTDNEGSGVKRKSYDATDRRAMDQLVRSTTKAP
jgi:membrane protein required for colicin V production